MATVSGWGASRIGVRLGLRPSQLIQEALSRALGRAQIAKTSVDALLACPSLSDPKFMEAHHIATECDLFDHAQRRPFCAKTIDVGGASPVSMLLQAKQMVENEGYNVVVVVGGDSVSSLNPREFVERADEAFASREVRQNISYLKSPYIPNAYAHCTTAHMQKHNVSREQLAMVSVLMSAQATYHPLAVQRRPYDLDEVLNSTSVGQNLNLLECARKA
ncbi:hypothetical protein GUITHDRAFT_150541, partial [Guillardia theta CCMP2712]